MMRGGVYAFSSGTRDVIELRLVEVLRAMVRFQACFLKPMKLRPRLFKRGRVDEKKNVKSELPG
ncbi:unnamed protein product [Ilex paraguariensis]|uniref:Uncharacterized protein n=1 Tax=Ilex paraguariensis TaxID=185542 RepID=A0ABC8S5G6_9AQUA